MPSGLRLVNVVVDGMEKMWSKWDFVSCFVTICWREAVCSDGETFVIMYGPFLRAVRAECTVMAVFLM